MDFMRYAEFIEICNAEGWYTDSLLVLLELDKAKACARSIVKIEKMAEVEDIPKEKIERFIKNKHEERIEYMLNALDYARVETGLGVNWIAYEKKYWKSKGNGEPVV